MNDEKLTILDHELVPKHELLDAKEEKKLVESLDITKEQLPHMYDDDPIVAVLGAKAGNVLKITRNSKTAGKTEYFRFVVPS